MTASKSLENASHAVSQLCYVVRVVATVLADPYPRGSNPQLVFPDTAPIHQAHAALHQLVVRYKLNQTRAIFELCSDVLLAAMGDETGEQRTRRVHAWDVRLPSTSQVWDDRETVEAVGRDAGRQVLNAHRVNQVLELNAVNAANAFDALIPKVNPPEPQPETHERDKHP